MNSLSVVILTRNAESKLEDCLKSIKGLGQIVILDGGSTDKTRDIAKKYGARVFKQKKGSYDTWRNQAKVVVKTDWLFYVDPDERVTPELRLEIQSILDGSRPRHTQLDAYAVPRRNFVFGKELKHGGWWPDYVLRLMRRDKLVRWEGELHEQPKINGEVGHLKEALIHLKEDNLSDMVTKTNKWSEVEARLLLDSGHPKMAWWRFLRPVATEIFDRLVLKLGFLDGVQGIIFSIYQGYSVFMRYAKLWEMQRSSK